MTGTRIVDLPDLGTVTDSASVVGELAGSGRFAATALRTYLGGTFATLTGLAAVDAARKRDTVSVMDFSAVGNGTTDDTAAVQAALNSLGSASIKGGTVLMPPGYSFRVGNITIPPGVTLQGPHSAGPGAPGMGNFSPPYNTQAALRTNSGTTITLQGGAGLAGLMIAPYGMSFQQTTAAAFAGTAITATGDDVVVDRCMIMGYALGFTATGVSRIRFRDCNMDNVAGIYVSTSTDVCHFDRVQMWPFATISQAGTDTLRRSGIGYRIIDSPDDTRFTDCFAYGNAVAFSVEGNCVGQVFTSCAADSTNVGIGIGFNIVGGATQVQLVDCQASAQNIGFNFTESVVGDVFVTMANCSAFSCTAAGVLIDTAALGDVSIRGGSISGCTNGITIASATPRVDIDGVHFESITAASAISLTVASSRVRIGPMCNFGSNGGGTNAVAINANLGFPTVASASALGLPMNASVIWVSGSVGIGTIGGGWAGRVVTLAFMATCAVFHSIGTAGIRLAGGVSVTATSGSTLVLIHTGTQWYQVGGTLAGHIELAGTGTNDNAGAGQIGEIVTASAGSAVTLPSGTSTNVVSISLAPGDWDVDGSVVFTISAACTVAQSWVNTGSAAPPGSIAQGGYNIIVTSIGSGSILPTGTARISLASTTTVYLGANVSLASGTASALGAIRARRMR